MLNEQIVRTRINEVMEAKGLNPRSISGEDQTFYAKCYMQLAKGKTLTMPVIIALLETIPDLSAEWLFRGVGEPFKKEVVENTPSWAKAMEERLMSAMVANEKKATNSDDNNSIGNLQVKVEMK